MHVTKRKMSRTLAAGAVAVASCVCGSSAWALSFDTNNIAVVTLNNATSDAAAEVSINEYNMFTGAFVASHVLPSAGVSALTLGGLGDHEGHLNLSANGQYLMLAGYRADVGDDNPVYESSASVARVIGRLDTSWNADTSTALTDAYSGTDINAVVSDNGLRFWTVGEGKYLPDPVNQPDLEVATTTGGLRFVANLGDTTTVNLSQTQTTGGSLEPDAYRSARIIDGQLYLNTASPESFVNRGAFVTENALPTASVDTPQTMVGVITNLEGNDVDNGQQLAPDKKGKQVPKTDLVMVDLDPGIPGFDTAYSTGGKDLYDKWALIYDSGEGEFVWQQVSDSGLFNSSDEILALDARVTDEGDVMLFASTTFGIYRLIDDAGYNAPFNLAESADSYFITAGGTEQFRGVAVLPEPTTFVLLGLSALAMTARRRHGSL